MGSSGPMILSVVLAAGYYEFVYTSADTKDEVDREVGGKSAFYANFATGDVRGDIQAADVIVLRGEVNLRVLDIRDQAALSADIRQVGPRVSAHFKYAYSPRGPPGTLDGIMHRKVVIVGTLRNISIGSAMGHATRHISVLDLSPTVEQVAAYHTQYQQYLKRQGTRPRPRGPTH